MIKIATLLRSIEIVETPWQQFHTDGWNLISLSKNKTSDK